MQTIETTPAGRPCDAWDSCPNPDHGHRYVTQSTILDPAGLEQSAVVRRTDDGLCIEQPDGAAVDLGVEHADPAGVEGPIVVRYEPGREVDGVMYPPAIFLDSGTGDGSMGLAQAGAVARSVLELLDDLLPAPEEALQVLRSCLRALNDARGTSHTVESVAEALALQQPLTQGGARRVARHIGVAV